LAFKTVSYMVRAKRRRPTMSREPGGIRQADEQVTDTVRSP
jgi:hypothetical protein